MNLSRGFIVLGFCLLGSLTDGAPIDSSVQNSIETRVIVDKLAFSSWKTDLTSASDTDAKRDADTRTQITEFIRSVFAGVNAIFEQLDAYGINLDIRLVGIEFVTDETISTHVYDGNRVSSNKVLDTFELWLKGKKFPRVDHTLLMTGWDLSDGTQSHVLGVAYLSKMCDPIDSLSAVEMKRNGNTVLTLAHELGHSLGANHDGDGNSCNPDSTKLMDSGRTQNSTLNFKFSACSRQYIKNYLQSLHDSFYGSCLSATNTDTPKLEAKQLGQLYDPDTVCRMSAGKDSYLGRNFYGPDGALDYSRVCTAIWCLDEYPYYVSVEGTDGFPCGSGKECSLGFCLDSATASKSVSDSCPFGDAPSNVQVYQGKSCAELITATDTSLCYSDSIRRACCASCAAAKTGIANCEYGDQASWCSTLSSADCYYNDGPCCGTCKKYETSIPNCKYGDRNSACPSYIAQNPARCSTNAETCCESCAPETPASGPASGTESGTDTGTNTGSGTGSGSETGTGTGTDTGSGTGTGTSSNTGTDTGTGSGTGTGTDSGTSSGTGTDSGTGTSSDGTATSSCQDQTTQCGLLIGVYGRHYLCYNPDNRALCCSSCKTAAKEYTALTDCPYGDGNPACPSYIAENRNRCATNSKVCCASCAGFNATG